MRTRDLWMLSGAFCLAAVAGVAMLSQNTFVEAFAPRELGPAADATPAAGTPEVAAAEAAVQRDHEPVVVAPVEAFVSTKVRDGDRVDTTGWTSGMVKGDIQLAVSILDRLSTITVAVEEARNPTGTGATFRHPWRSLVRVERGRGTPTFEVKDIPFSDYPYIVSVYAPGLNGGRRTVTVDANTPLVDDIVLAITPGSPFTVLARDQDAAPYSGLDVRMQPVGDPAGRPRALGTTDNFGSVVFESVLAGDYQVTVSQDGQPLTEVQTITVQPGNRSFGTKVQGQGYTITVPRGVPLQVQVNDPRGYGVADVELTATASDKIK
ncbi:MAG TPA: carboxypeptidase-like regulatory domain-containing protein, partial [Planctomycetota bacterium]|nr:carboxypeptidase-like regulatory domain-containing protein [Planctomycetota bacterium]